jgi:hypothetical protein
MTERCHLKGVIWMRIKTVYGVYECMKMGYHAMNCSQKIVSIVASSLV